MILINGSGHESRIADPDRRSTRTTLLSLHRRFELLVAALAVAAVAILAGEAEPAPAQTMHDASNGGCLTARHPLSSGSEAPFLQRKIRCRTVSSRLQDGPDS